MRKKLLIVDNNLTFAINIFNYLKNNNSLIDVIGIANNEEVTLKMLEEMLPDILILDLNLPGINGGELLEILNKRKVSVFLMSDNIEVINEINVFVFRMVRKIYIKPFGLDTLNQDLLKITRDNYNREIKEIIENELKHFNFNKNSKGYKYLIQCLEYCYTQPQLLDNMEKNLFFRVAQDNHLSNSNMIKWSIQKTIISMERYTKNKVILEYFPFSTNPTSKVFISTMREIITNKINEKI